MSEHIIDYKVLFEALPGSFLILEPDAPHYTVLAISDELLTSTSRERAAVVGKSVFEVYPENPQAITATGPSSFRLSLENAMHTKKPDQMPLVRYDVQNGEGVFEARYWSAGSKPVLDHQGEVLYIIHATRDITGQIQAEKRRSAVRQMEKTYSLFMQAPVGVCIVTGPENIVELANDELLEFLGRGADILGKPLSEAMPEAQAQGFSQLLDQVRKTGKAHYATEFPVTLMIGGKAQLRYYNLVYQPYYENPGDQTAAGVFSVAHNVTEQVLARKKVEESERRFRDLVSETMVATGIYMGREMRIEYANEAMLKLWGKDASAIGKTVRQALPELEGQPFHELLDKVFTSGETYWGKEDRADLVVDGKLQIFYFNFFYKALRNTEGAVYGILNMATDVTEQVLARQKVEESEARLQAIIHATPECIKIVSPDGTLQFMNTSGLKMIEGEADLLGKACVYGIIAPEHVPGWIEKHRRVCQGESLSWEFDIIGLNGTRRHMETHAVPLSGAEGTSQLAVTRDITQRQLAQADLAAKNAELIRINQDLDRTNKDLDTFVYTASHDLKAPILNIEGLLKALQREQTKPQPNLEKVEQMHQLLNGSVSRFKATIRDLSEVAKSAKESQEDVNSIPLDEVLKEVLADLQTQIQESGARLDVQLEGQQVHFSRKNLKSVLYNLVSNAIKYRSPDRRPRVQITCQEEEDYQVLSVKDNGLGIDMRQEEKIFALFKRLHNHVEGSGIGLYIVKKMVENSGGKIVVESQVGVGSAFRVYFKQQQAESLQG